MQPHKKLAAMRIESTATPSDALYKMSCGLSNIELIIKAANQSWRIPRTPKDAATGMVPYRQSGEAMPSALAERMPRTPKVRLRCDSKISRIFPFAKTEINEPMVMPNAQYQNICEKTRVA